MDTDFLLKKLPRASLGFFPTPLCRLENFSRELGVNVYIKRDDFTGMSLFGGNKVRKLEYLLGQALSDGCEYVITYGATQSNHAMETASCARRLGLKPILYLTAVVEPKESDIRANLLLDKILDAEIHIVSILPGETEDDADERAFQMGLMRKAELESEGHGVMNIPMGGATALGSVGFAYGYFELIKQAEAMEFTFDRIYHSTGTGGTMAGLHAGRVLAQDNTEIISITVSNKSEAYIDKVEMLANDCLKLMVDGASLASSLPTVNRADLKIDNNFYYPGYEMPNEKASEAIRLLARTEGLFADSVYTGKALSALIEHARNKSIKPGSNILFWHTGGEVALFAEPEIQGRLY